MGYQEAEAKKRALAESETCGEMQAEKDAAGVRRQVKDRLFRHLFTHDTEALLKLYNALNKTEYSDPSEMKIVTIEGAVYIVMKNDLAFIMAGTLSLYEHQSTMSGNLPVRFMIYLAEEYQKIIQSAKRSLYGSSRIVLPSPRCVVFYNGEEDAGGDAADEWEISLSEAFEGSAWGSDVEVKVHVLNINWGHNRELMEKCPLLGQYSQFVAIGRKYMAEGTEIREAYAKAIDYCIEHDILKRFFKDNKAEVLGMILEEFDADKYERTIREEGKEMGALSVMIPLVRDGILTVSEAAQRMSMPEKAFRAAMAKES